MKAAEEELETYLQPGICNELELRLWRRLHVAKLFKLCTVTNNNKYTQKPSGIINKTLFNKRLENT